MRTLLRLSAALACAFAAPAFAQINIGAGSTFDFGDAAINFGCSDLIVAGQATASGALTGLRDLSIAPGGGFAVGSGQIALGGNFSNGGAFSAGTGTVGIVDACGSGVSQVSGSTNFYRFAASSGTGKQLVLPANVTQSVANSLVLTGVVGHLLQVLSSTPGQRAELNLAPGAAQTIAYVSARDNAATGATIAPGPPAAFNSADGGNLVNWFIGVVGGNGTIPTPVLGVLGQLLLLGGMLLVAWRMVRRHGDESA